MELSNDMQKSLFLDVFDRLTRFFGGVDKVKEARASEYFKKLSGIDHETLSAAVSQLIDEGGQFPTISKIKQTVYRIRQNQGQAKALIGSCDRCNGGFVIVNEDGQSFAYRADCEHGRMLSKSIKTYYGKKEQIEDLRSEFVNYASQEPIKTLKAFCRSNAVLKQMNPQRWKEIGGDLKDLVGVETFKKYWVERDEIEVDAPNS